MNSYDYSKLKGTHAIFGGSNHAWLGYDDEKIIRAYYARHAKDLGTALHEYARQRISHSLKMSKSDSYAVVNHILESKLPRGIIQYSGGIESIMETLVPYVNDAIKYRMKPEELTYFADFFYGWADALSFTEKNKTLRIHDFKSGTITASMTQLKIYAAFYCLGVGLKPENINIELRIYQNGEVVVDNPEAEEIQEIMDKCEHDNAVLMHHLKEGEPL